MGTPLTDRLAALGRGASPDGRAVVLADRPDGTVVRVGPVVSKAHAPDSDRGDLAARIAVARDPLLAGILLAPLGDGRLLDADGRPASLWPLGAPVAPDDPDAAPWEEAAALLARLHSVPVAELPGPIPPMRGPAKVARALRRLRAAGAPGTAAATVLRAASGLPPWAHGEAAPPRPPTAPLRAGAAPHPPQEHPIRAEAAPPRATPPRTGPAPLRAEAAPPRGASPRTGFLCHGDLHLGQLVRHPATDGPWLLIDVDDLGLGDPAWDLARPAAWYATGLLAPDVWQRFLTAYRAGGGPAVCPEGDPWPELDVPARALTVQSAALALVRAAGERRAPDEVEQALVDACARILALPGGECDRTP
ncbi:phosphotransferase family protein [Streptomyces sp. bgisy100]|uniref:phosphotransferase family protein n=1 Tax=Streptomyces sp. bgisy100 TaxID=3413783 RepID=UPI003D757F95